MSFFRERFYYKQGCTSILKFPDDSSGERTRHMPIDEKQDGPLKGANVRYQSLD